METEEEPVRIRTAADLWAVLRTGSMEARTAVLQSVVEQPERPLALGTHEGEDFVDLLLGLTPLCTGPMRHLHILCLMSYVDEKTTRFFVEEFSQSQDATIVIMLGKRLALEKEPDFFKPFLWSDSAARALAAARICSAEESLTIEERMRLAILLDDYAPPPINEKSLDQWMDGLLSRHRLKVRRMAGGRGREALELWGRWEQLPPVEQEWLLDLTAQVDPSLLAVQVRARLSQSSVRPYLVRHAMTCEIALPVSLLRSEDPDVRALAISTGLADHELERYLSAESTTQEAAAATTRCETHRLIELLGDDRWQVRARATASLVAKGSATIPVLRGLACSEVPATKVAAVAALQLLGDEVWLQAKFG